MTVENAMRSQRGMNMARKVGKVGLFFMDLVYPMGWEKSSLFFT